jgi:hypothetical protein
VRDGRFKLHFPHDYATLGGKRGGRDGAPAPYTTAKIGLELFDLRADPGETTNVAAQHPEVVARLQQLAQEARTDLGDALHKTSGSGVRAAGKLGPDDARLVW